MNIIKSETLSTRGIILDGLVLVGKFDLCTSEDSYGQREINEANVKLAYVDIAKGKTKNLLFIVVDSKSTADTYTVIDKLGWGHIEIMRASTMFADYAEVSFGNVKFIKAPQS